MLLLNRLVNHEIFIRVNNKEYSVKIQFHYRLPVELVVVVAGVVDLQMPTSKHEIETAYVHENYNARDAYANDIALIKACNFIMTYTYVKIL